MKITFDQNGKDRALLTSVALSKSRAMLREEIQRINNMRSGSAAVRALQVSSLRQQLVQLTELHEEIDLARRLAGFLVQVQPPQSPGMTFEECMSDPTCEAYPRCGCPSTNECVRSK